ncbi:hypothetical protein CDAR_533921 [Caerostris darwini]|uniref:Uncharacterized protein n=1 Tax=Caerostris darwini TaxID=1538125 RepID=A0AAV4SAL4_9ARAC|nr:hypothetical protein CDAR_533921 [Caerostris darwini]
MSKSDSDNLGDIYEGNSDNVPYRNKSLETILPKVKKGEDFPENEFAPTEEYLKKKEIDLFIELVMNDMEKKKESINLQDECNKLQEEVTRLQNVLTEKDGQLSKAVQENVCLKKNISSLFKTAKMEIELKDSLLKDANKEIDALRTQIQNISTTSKGSNQNKESKGSNQNKIPSFQTQNTSNQNWKKKVHYEEKYYNHNKEKGKRKFEAESTSKRMPYNSYHSDNQRNKKQKFH